MKIAKTHIIGAVCWGGGFSLHAEYHIQVVPDDPTAAWSIYRRYSAFEKLHAKILSKFGEDKLKELAIPFPVKNFFGSRLNTSTEAMNSRKVELQAFLDKIFTIEELAEDLHDLYEFLDMSGRGVSGIVKEKGANQVLKESFVQVKVIKSIPLAPFWSWCFVVLLKTGELFVVASKYDLSNQALATWSLTKNDVRVVPKARNQSICLSSVAHGQKLFIKLLGMEESSFWMRSLGDFSSSSSYQNLLEKTTESRIQSMKRPSSKPADSARASGVVTEEHIRHQGTGNTQDELSNMYGI